MSFARYTLGLFLLIAFPAIACAQGNEDVIHAMPVQLSATSAGVIVDKTGMWVEYRHCCELRDPKSIIKC